jgi:phosphate:Na+ symporter
MEIVLSVLGGLGLFLFALNNLSDSLKEILVRMQKMDELLYKEPHHRNSTGIFITVILDSSSAVIIITIVLVKCKSVNIPAVAGVVLAPISGQLFEPAHRA